MLTRHKLFSIRFILIACFALVIGTIVITENPIRGLLVRSVKAERSSSAANGKVGPLFANPTSTVFINEFHYDDAGADANEFVEVAAPAGTNMANYSIVLYNGATGAVYDTDALSGTTTNQSGGYGFVSILYPVDGVQNGSPDGIALINTSTNTLIQFLCYEGTFVGVGGLANGISCTDIGVVEGGTQAEGSSLQLQGTGTTYGNFTWAVTNSLNANTRNNVNTGQTFTGGGGGQNLSINDVTMAEGNAGTTTFTFTVSLGAAATTAVTFDIATADGTAQDDNPALEDNDYVAKTETGRTIGIGSSSTTFTVDVNGDLTSEGNETFFVNVTNVTGATVTDGQGQGTITNDDFTVVAIHDIQGNGAASPFDGQAVTTNGIVTLIKTTTNNGGAANGFFIQTPDASVDADPNTSEGILVFTSSVPTVLLGDAVTVTGTVDEFFNMTEITSPTSITVNSGGNALPLPIVLTPTILDPAAGPTQPQLEKFEGMRMSAASLISVAPNDNFFDVFVVLSSVPRPVREPGIPASLTVPPDPTSGLPDCCIPRWDENPERLLLDTNARAGAPLLPYTSNVTFTNVAGPLDFSFDEYRLIPDAALSASANMTAVPVPTPAAGEFTVATYNIENFAGGATQRDKASLAIRNVMRYPDIIGVQEILSLAVLQGLATDVNNDAVAAGDPNPMYTAHLIPAATGTQHVGFLVKTARVSVTIVTQSRASETYINPLTGLPETTHDRPPLVLFATVDPTGPFPTPVFVVVNHPRSFIDIDQDPSPPGDGARVRAKRTAQAESIAGLFQELQTNNPSTMIIGVGDYNAYQFNDGYTDPLSVIKGIPTADNQIVVDQSPDVVTPDYTNLADLILAPNRYSFIFEGTPQLIDHILVNTIANARFRHIAVARHNADFPGTPAAAFVNNAAIPEGNSDHDSPIAYFGFAPTAANGLVTGRITSSEGQPVAGAVVRLSGSQERRAITDANGHYRFDRVETTGFYTVTPSRANFTFSPASRAFSQLGEHTEAVFSGATNSDTQNPLDTAEYFVRQQYVDLLNREPDEGGFNYWSDRILECGSDAVCVSARRREVAAAFFIEAEFQQTGSFIYGMYKGSLGRQPAFGEYLGDRNALSPGANLDAQKDAFANVFVGRSEFVARYQAQATAESFVDALLANVLTVSGVDLRGERLALISKYNQGDSLNAARAGVVRQLSDTEAFRQAEYNRAFVLTEYFSYLRRDPDQGGFDFWVNVLDNREPGNFRGMVCAFITSAEYQLRFSSTVSRNDEECGR